LYQNAKNNWDRSKVINSLTGQPLFKSSHIKDFTGCLVALPHGRSISPAA
jgi:hypothetical protein